MSFTPNNLDRRFLLGSLAGVAGAAAISHVAKAGPLNPPAGPVAGTGRTLDEVFNKIPTPIGGGSGDGRIPLPGGTSQVVISQSGSYVLTGNLTVAGTPLRITAPNVTLDLGGWSITCSAPVNIPNPNTSFYGLEIAGQPRVTVRNGRIIGGFLGLVCNGSLDVLLEDLDVFDSGLTGINGTSCPGAILRRVRVVRPGAASQGFPNLILIGIFLDSSAGYTLDQCAVTGMANQSPSGAPTSFGIRSADGSGTLTGCSVSASAQLAGSIGFSVNNTGLLRNSTSKNFATLSDARDGGGNFAL